MASFSEEFDHQDRIIAMNPSGIVEQFEGGDDRGENDMSDERTEMNDMGRRLKCTGDMCVIDDAEIAEKMTSTAPTKTGPSYTTYLIYLVIALLVCAALYVAYKKFVCKE